MATRQVFIDGIGEVTLAKRRGARSLRLSINSLGKVRVGLPYWLPYQTAIDFAFKKRDWIAQHQAQNHHPLLRHGQRIGKAHTLYFKSAAGNISSRVTETQIIIITGRPPSDMSTQIKARTASDKALKMEASKLLPQRHEYLSKLHNLPHAGLKIRKLTSRWGSCSSSGVITLSYYLMQLPWELIDYVILHELAHTKYLNHSPKFWQLLDELTPEAKKKQKIIRIHKPRVEPWNL